MCARRLVVNPVAEYVAKFWNGHCARRRVSEANRGNATALRPEMAALPRNCPQTSNDIYARPRDVEDAVNYKNQGKGWHKICRRGKP